jgi:hypothetical protein
VDSREVCGWLCWRRMLIFTSTCLTGCTSNLICFNLNPFLKFLLSFVKSQNVSRTRKWSQFREDLSFIPAWTDSGSYYIGCAPIAPGPGHLPKATYMVRGRESVQETQLHASRSVCHDTSQPTHTRSPPYPIKSVYLPATNSS